MKRLVGGCAALALAGCATEADTGGAQVSLPLHVVEGAQSFRTALGWEVTLTEAHVGVEAVRLWEEPPPSASRGPASWFVRSAKAHSGFDEYARGELRAEWLGPFAIDVLAPGETALGEGQGVAGEARSLSLQLAPLPDGPDVRVAGVAEKEGLRVEFAGGLGLTEEQRALVALPASIRVEEGARVELVIDVARWVDQVDFARVEPAPAEAFAAGSQAATGLQLGVRSYGTFTVR